MRRVISLWLPRFATDLAQRPAAPSPEAAAARAGAVPASPQGAPPLVLALTEGNRRLVHAADATAMAEGVAPGMTLSDARAIVPGLAVADAHPDAEARARTRLAAWCSRFTPLVADGGAEPGGGAGLWLDVTGCAHLFGGEAALLAQVASAVEALCFTARAALASTPGAAWALARYGRAHSLPMQTPNRLPPPKRGRAGEGESAPTVAVARSSWQEASCPGNEHGPEGGAMPPPRPSPVPGEGVRVAPASSGLCLPANADIAVALAPLPIAALRVAPEHAADLARLGLRTVGDLAATPRAALAHRFAPALLRRLDQALGRVAEPVSPARPAPAHSVRVALAEPIGHAEAIAAGLEHLLAGLARKLERDGVGARRLAFLAYRVDGTVARVRVGAGRPTRDPAHWQRLFRDRLETIDPGFGIDALRLSALRVEPFETQQAALAPTLATLRSKGFAPAVEALVDRLANRLGPAGVFRLAPRESHWPERAVARVPAAEAPSRPAAWPASAATGASRPLRLLPWPDAVAALAPDPAAPPARFTWRRQSLAVHRAEGPERIVPEWWRLAPESGDGSVDDAVRDYYRIETADGRRLWLARAPSPTTPETRWYVHGVFD